MLTLKRCRKLLGKDEKNLSDAEVESLKDSLYLLSNNVIDSYEKINPVLSGGKQVKSTVLSVKKQQTLNCFNNPETTRIGSINQACIVDNGNNGDEYENR